MSKHGPILAVVSDACLPLVADVRAAGLDSIVETGRANALQVFDQVPPAAVIAMAPVEGDAVFETLATRVYRLASDERLADAAPAALFLVGISLAPVLWLEAMGRKRGVA